MTNETFDLRTVRLASGSHAEGSTQMCAMEAVAYLMGEPHTDRPVCVSPVLGDFVRSFNDGLRSDEERARVLGPMLLDFAGTAGTPEHEERRSFMALDWLVRVHTPAWLTLAGLHEEAAALMALPEITKGTDPAPCLLALTNAQRRAAAASAAARTAASAAAWDAASAAARTAASAAAWDAASAAAWYAARTAASAAAQKKLEPTVRGLQDSAIELLRRMIDVHTTVVKETVRDVPALIGRVGQCALTS